MWAVHLVWVVFATPFGLGCNAAERQHNLVRGAQQLILAGGAAAATTGSIERTVAEESHFWANPILAVG